MSYSYFVSFQSSNKNGMIEITMSKEVETYDDIIKISKLIEENGKHDKVVINNYILLKGPSKEILTKIPKKRVCPNKVDGVCPLHNLFCAYPECEDIE